MSLKRIAWVGVSVLLSQVALGTATGQTSTYEDPRDGTVYPTVQLGTQTWLAANLRFDSGPGTRCLADLPANCISHGRLYAWESALRACPPGWHLSSESDWQALERYLGMSAGDVEQREYRGSDEGQQLRTDGTSGFNALLGGYMRPDGTPRRLGERAAFWTGTQAEQDGTAWHRDISTDPRIYRSPVDHGYFLSVRCVQG